MGSNLSQVFIANTPTLESGNTFTGIASTPEIGIWDLTGRAWVSTALYKTSVDVTDEVAGTATDEVTDDLTTVANPLWLYSNLQFVQGTANNPIATPMINTRNIRSIRHDGFKASAGAIVTISDNDFTGTAGDEIELKFVFKKSPTDYNNFYDVDGLSIFSKQFPLSAARNHFIVNISFVVSNLTDVSAGDTPANLQAAINDNPVLSKIFTADVSSADLVLTAIHPGVIFELISTNLTSGADPVDQAAMITAPVIGSGNDWQVSGDEARCRSRYGNFNRMYLPQNMPSYTNKGEKYDKITILYEHNWPTSTGIAPAGALNEVVLYYTSTDGTVVTTNEGTFDDAFVLSTQSYAAAGIQYVW